MAKPLWLCRALAIYTVILFTVDTVSDTYVGVDLGYNRCHYRYSASVLAFVAIPGLLTGWYYLKQILKFCGLETEGGSCSRKFLYLCGTLIGPIIFIPCTFAYLTYAIFTYNLSTLEVAERIGKDYVRMERTERYAKGMKSLEMVTESFPQFVISLFIMQALQVKEPINIFSTTVSAFSVLYGLGDFLAMVASDIDKMASEHTGANYPLSKTVYGTLSIFIDTTLRSFTLAYWMTMSKAYVIIVPFAFSFVMTITILIKESSIKCSHIIPAIVSGFGISFVSFCCSSFEHEGINLRLRPISKAIFAIIFVTFSIFFGITASPKVFSKPQNISSNHTFKPSDCSNFCQGNKTDIEQEAFEDYCKNLWEHIEPDSFIHQTICIVIGILFVFSLLEWILESYFSWTPYKKLYEGSNDAFLNKNIEQADEDLEIQIEE